MTYHPRFTAPAVFYTVMVFAERSGRWEHMSVDLLDRDQAAELVNDYRADFAHWLVIRVDTAAGTAKDVTDAFMLGSDDDCHSYAAQRREATVAGHYA